MFIRNKLQTKIVLLKADDAGGNNCVTVFGGLVKRKVKRKGKGEGVDGKGRRKGE